LGATNPPDRAHATFDGTHSVDLHLPAAACYTLEIHVIRRDPVSGYSDGHRSVVQPEQTVTVFDRDEPRRVDLDVTQAEIDAAVKRFGR
jgi:hypothetical protein